MEEHGKMHLLVYTAIRHSYLIRTKNNYQFTDCYDLLSITSKKVLEYFIGSTIYFLRPVC